MKIDRIFFINDDKNVARRSEIENELNSYDIVSCESTNTHNKMIYERFSAIRLGSTIETRQGKSHIAVLKIAKSRGYSNIIILEDDFKFVVSKEEFYKKMENLTGVYLDVFLLAYNLISYTHSTLHPDLLRVMQARNTTGYIITVRYYDVLIECFEKAIANLERTDEQHLYRIDIAWNKLQATDPWYCFTTPIGEKIV